MLLAKKLDNSGNGFGPERSFASFAWYLVDGSTHVSKIGRAAHLTDSSVPGFLRQVARVRDQKFQDRGFRTEILHCTESICRACGMACAFGNLDIQFASSS